MRCPRAAGVNRQSRQSALHALSQSQRDRGHRIKNQLPLCFPSPGVQPQHLVAATVRTDDLPVQPRQPSIPDPEDSDRTSDRHLVSKRRNSVKKSSEPQPSSRNRRSRSQTHDSEVSPRVSHRDPLTSSGTWPTSPASHRARSSALQRQRQSPQLHAVSPSGVNRVRKLAPAITVSLKDLRVSNR